MKKTLVLFFITFSTTVIASAYSQTEVVKLLSELNSNVNKVLALQSISLPALKVVNSEVVIREKTLQSIGGSYALWSFNTPKFAQIGGIRYFGVNEKIDGQNVPVVYKKDLTTNNKCSDEWCLAWKGVANSTYRPPTIFADSILGKLHIIHEGVSGNINGAISHSILENADNWNASITKTVDTLPWSTNNYYIGGTYNGFANTIYLCASFFNGDNAYNHLKCGVYKNGVWVVKAVASYSGHAYLYPSMSGDNDEDAAMLSISGYKIGGDFATREVNFTQKIDSNANPVPGKAVTTGHHTTKVYTNNDSLRLSNGGTISIETETNNSGLNPSSAANTLPNKAGLKSFHFGKDDIYTTTNETGLFGMGYNLVEFDSKPVILGAGNFSIWNGQKWEAGSYESAKYPKSEFAYGSVSILRKNSGATDTMLQKNINLIQELVHIQTGMKTIVMFTLEKPKSISERLDALYSILKSTNDQVLELIN